MERPNWVKRLREIEEYVLHRKRDSVTLVFLIWLMFLILLLAIFIL